MNNEMDTNVSGNQGENTPSGSENVNEVSNTEIVNEVSDTGIVNEASGAEIEDEASNTEPKTAVTEKDSPKPKDKSQVSKKLSALWADKRSFWKRLLISAVAVFAACFTFVFFGPLELVAFSGESLVFGYKDIVWLLVATMFAVTAVLSVLISLLKGKIFNYIVCFIFSSTVAAYIQSMFLNGSLGALTGDAIPWAEMRSEMGRSIAVWVIVYIAFYFLMYLNRKMWTNAIYYVSAFIIFIQFFSSVGIFAGLYDMGNVEMEDCQLTTRGMYEYSSKDNVFVFVLDRLDFDYIQRVLDEDPDFLEPLDGFTGYNNAISAFARTQPALNQMLTGCEDLAYNVPTEKFFKDSWKQDGKDLLRDLSGAGFTSEFYTDVYSLFSDPDYVAQYVINSQSGAPKEINKKVMLSKLMELSAYRYLPINFKPFYWADTNYFNQDVLVSDDSKTYVFADHEYADGFKTAVADREQSSFKFYHFNGPHAPYTLTSEGKLSETETSVTEQLMGCMNILYATFDRMKELGIYDDATIIITGDHGMHQGDKKPVLAATRLGLFYKPANSSGTKLTWSSAPVCTDNIPATLIKNVGGDYSLYGTPLDEIGENDEVVRYYYKSASSSGSYDEVKYYVYEIIGDAADFDNWKLIETKDITDDKNKFY